MKLAAVALLFLLPFLKPGEAHAKSMVFGGIDVGQTTVVSDDEREPTKNGPSFGAYVGGSLLPTDDSYLSLGIGIQSHRLTGTKGNRKQELNFQGLLVDLDYRWNFGGFEAGLLARVNSGEGASLEAKNTEDKTTSISAGPEVGYRWRDSGGDIVVRLGAVRDLNVKEQANTSIFAGVSYWLSMGPSTQPPPVTPPSTPEELPLPAPISDVPQEAATEPVAAAATTLRFKTDVFVFAIGSDRLIPASQKKVQEIAKILSRHAQNFTSIEASGHTDSTGKAEKNQQLSERRAKTVGDLLAKSGIPAAIISSKGYGSSQPLEGLDSKNEANRRVEIKIDGLTEGHEAIQELKQFLNNN